METLNRQLDSIIAVVISALFPAFYQQVLFLQWAMTDPYHRTEEPMDPDSMEAIRPVLDALSGKEPAQPASDRNPQEVSSFNEKEEEGDKVLTFCGEIWKSFFLQDLQSR